MQKGLWQFVPKRGTLLTGFARKRWSSLAEENFSCMWEESLAIYYKHGPQEEGPLIFKTGRIWR